jgi:hypothetical protein
LSHVFLHGLLVDQPDAAFQVDEMTCYRDRANQPCGVGDWRSMGLLQTNHFHNEETSTRVFFFPQEPGVLVPHTQTDRPSSRTHREWQIRSHRGSHPQSPRLGFQSLSSLQSSAEEVETAGREKRRGHCPGSSSNLRSVVKFTSNSDRYS